MSERTNEPPNRANLQPSHMRISCNDENVKNS